MVAGWFWYLGRPEKIVEKSPVATTTKTADLPAELVVNWAGRENRLESLLADKKETGVEPKELQLTSDLVARYRQKDLRVVASAATGTIENYGRELGTILKPYGEPRENELTIVGQIYDTQDPTAVEKLTAIKKLHQTALADFLKIETPAEAVSLQLAIVNDLALLLTLIGNMEKIVAEPILALQSAQVYQVSLLSFYSRLSQINDYFRSRGIVFKPDERVQIFINTR